MKAEEISRVVKERYSKAAQTSGAREVSCCCPSAAPPGAGFAAQQGLYTPEDLASVPELAVKLSRGCGNPVSFADLRAGEVVVDLGCGAGLDVIFAARRIAPGGKVVGVDFAQPMIERATQAVAEAGLTDLVQFVVGDLAESYLPDDFADAVISNCVINLCPQGSGISRGFSHSKTRRAACHFGCRLFRKACSRGEVAFRGDLGRMCWGCYGGAGIF